MSATPAFISAPKIGVVQIVNADASNLKTLATAGASGSKIIGIMAASDDTSARVIQFGITRAATFYPIGSVSVPALSGSDGTNKAVNLLDITMIAGLPIDADGQRYLFLESGDTLQAKSLTTVTAAKTVTLAAGFGNF